MAVIDAGDFTASKPAKFRLDLVGRGIITSGQKEAIINGVERFGSFVSQFDIKAFIALLGMMATLFGYWVATP